MGIIGNRAVSQKREPLQKYWNKGGFILCTGGSAEVSTNEQYFRLTRGSVFIVTPLVQVCDFRPSPDYSEMSFISELKLFYPVFQMIADTAIPLRVSEVPCWQLSDEEMVYIVHLHEQLQSKLSRMAATVSEDELRLLEYQARLIRHQAMLEVVGNRIRQFPVRSEQADHRAVFAYRFILSLHDNYSRQRSVSWYASRAQLSPGHFTTLIKGVTGKTPSQWIATVTTAYAKMMLEQGDRTIKEIAQALNFPEQFTFRKYFKQHTGLSPKEYRSQYANGYFPKAVISDGIAEKEPSKSRSRSPFEPAETVS